MLAAHISGRCHSFTRLVFVASSAGVISAATGCNRGNESSLTTAVAADEQQTSAVSVAASNTPAVPGAVYQDKPGEIESVPLSPRQGSSGTPLFESLDAKKIGIDFFHKWNELLGQNRNTATGSGVTIGDYDADGLADIFLPRTTDGGRLFRNLGGFRFEDVTEKALFGAGREPFGAGLPTSPDTHAGSGDPRTAGGGAGRSAPRSLTSTTTATWISSCAVTAAPITSTSIAATVRSKSGPRSSASIFMAPAS